MPLSPADRPQAAASICLFCGSSNDTDPAYLAAATGFGQDLAARGVRSTDLADSFVLTFATIEFIPSWVEPAAPRNYGDLERATEPQAPAPAPWTGGGGNSWMG